MFCWILFDLFIEMFWYIEQTIEPYSRTERTNDTYKVTNGLILEKNNWIRKKNNEFVKLFY